MDQTQLIKALVKVLREDIKKTLKEEIRNATFYVWKTKSLELTE